MLPSKTCFLLAFQSSFLFPCHPLLWICKALIAQIEALTWEDPSSQIETLSPAQVIEECLPLVGQLLSQKNHNNQFVNATLVKAWDFVVPFSFVVLGPNRFLFKFSKQEHISKIFKHTTWNVNGSMLVLQCWSPAATLTELQFNKSPFLDPNPWVSLTQHESKKYHWYWERFGYSL